MHDGSEKILLEEAKLSHFSPIEKEFFDDYSIADLIDDDNSFFHSRGMLGEELEIAPFVIPGELKRDFSELKVTELKEECRERGLPVSGTKAVLIERIQADVEKQIAELRRQHKAKTKMKRPHITGRLHGERSTRPVNRPIPQVSPETEQYLEELVKEYIKASGGKASSRDIGRYLSVNADSSGQRASPEAGQTTALSELKGLYGGLNSFIVHREDSFEKVADDSPDRTSYEYLVALRD